MEADMVRDWYVGYDVVLKTFSGEVCCQSTIQLTLDPHALNFAPTLASRINLENSCHQEIPTFVSLIYGLSFFLAVLTLVFSVPPV